MALVLLTVEAAPATDSPTDSPMCSPHHNQRRYLKTRAEQPPDPGDSLSPTWRVLREAYPTSTTWQIDLDNFTVSHSVSQIRRSGKGVGAADAADPETISARGARIYAKGLEKGRHLRAHSANC